jgi:hypothetical protein
MKIIIADNHAWEKKVELDKAVVRIGSSASSDIQLSSPYIAPVHLQLHYLPEEFGCKVLNLGDEVSVSRGDHQEVLRSYARTELKNGDEILLDAYRVRVQLPFTTRVIQHSPAISATLSFPSTNLYAHAPTIGWLTVKNTGEQSPSQFHVAVSGLQTDCIKIDPIPLLYAGAQEDVRIQLFHRGLYPYAGQTELSIRVFAPMDYPGEQVLIEQGIYVEPVFGQELAFSDDMDAGAAAPVTIPDLNEAAHSTTSSVPSSKPPISPPQAEPVRELPDTAPQADQPPRPAAYVAESEIDVEELVGDAVAEPERADRKEKKTPPAKPTPKPVIVRDLPDEFWDEDE